MLIPLNRLVAVLLVAAVTAACGGSGPESGPAGTTAPATDRSSVSLDKNDYPVLPDVDAGADLAVSAEDGGAGFTGEGWETNTDFDLIGDPRAVKGGSYRMDTSDFPGTTRMYGPDTTVWSQVVHSMVYETLLGMHPTSLEFIPALATHWQVSDDQRLFRFRIDPNARFSDGEPVTAQDVVASYDLIMDPATQAPNYRVVFERFERPVAESKYIVSVQAKESSWRNLVDLNGFSIFPAHVLETLEGDDYLRKYNFKLMPGSGPYTLLEKDIDRGNQVTVRRRTDYWAQSQRRNVGLNNFDEVTDVVVRDRNLAFEMVKRGDLDYYLVNRAQMWAEELEFEQIEMGWMQRRKIFNQEPQGIQAMAFNMRKPPFDDIRVRQAMNLLFNRQRLIENLFYNEYLPQNSIFPGGPYENPNNPRNEYNPKRAIELLAAAGWSERDSQGRLLKNGQPFNVELLYGQQTFEPILTVLQEDLRRVGISLNLRFVTFATLIKLLDERQFELLQIGYSASKPFPTPESMFQSDLADQPASNNLTGFKNDRADEIIQAYVETAEVGARIDLLRELDGIVTSQYPFMLQWYAPFHRLVYWNKFSHPDSHLTRIGDYLDPRTLWWEDPEKRAALEEARRNRTSLEIGPSEIHYWDDFENRLEIQDTGSQ